MESDLLCWIGASGKEHEFWVYKTDQEFDALGAVFMYVKKSDAQKPTVLYVNQTNRMDLVSSNPIADEIVGEYEPSQIHILLNDSVSERKGIMADIIIKHNPPGNLPD